MNPKNSLLALTLLMLLAAATQASAQGFNVIHNFTGGNDGSDPMAGLSIDNAGNLYGTTSSGGAGFGTVFKLSNNGGSWVLTPLYSFAGGRDGVNPMARVTIGPDGSLYGTTSQSRAMACSGNGTCGTVFNLRPGAKGPASGFAPWTETVLYRFQGVPDGANPSGDLIFDNAGSLYGTTQYGGYRSKEVCGTVYKLAPSNGGWTESVLYRFAKGGEGDFQPMGGVIFDNAGNLYGTTTYYVPGEVDGTVFELTPAGSSWIHRGLFSFGDDDIYGGYPTAGLIFDTVGDLFGATPTGGSGGGGTVFELTPSGGSWNVSLVYGFTGGIGPYASLLMDAAGNLYGTTVSEGPYSKGTVFKLTPSGSGYSYTSLHDFTGGSDGGLPYSSLVMDASGTLYGTASQGGTNGAGVAFQVSP